MLLLEVLSQAQDGQWRASGLLPGSRPRDKAGKGTGPPSSGLHEYIQVGLLCAFPFFPSPTRSRSRLGRLDLEPFAIPVVLQTGPESQHLQKETNNRN